jgi:molybdopterin converting factor subunit 1
MELSVLLFASWAEAIGAASVTLTVPREATVADVLSAATARAAGRTLPRPMVAVNHRYAKPETPVRQGDEIAIIPPVAGG